jgi:hypothetical protein
MARIGDLSGRCCGREVSYFCSVIGAAADFASVAGAVTTFVPSAERLISIDVTVHSESMAAKGAGAQVDRRTVWHPLMTGRQRVPLPGVSWQTRSMQAEHVIAKDGTAVRSNRLQTTVSRSIFIVFSLIRKDRQMAL